MMDRVNLTPTGAGALASSLHVNHTRIPWPQIIVQVGFVRCRTKQTQIRPLSLTPSHARLPQIVMPSCPCRRRHRRCRRPTSVRCSWRSAAVGRPNVPLTGGRRCWFYALSRARRTDDDMLLPIAVWHTRSWFGLIVWEHFAVGAVRLVRWLTATAGGRAELELCSQ